MPLRVLQLYVTVWMADGSPTPLRMKPQTVVVIAPVDNFAWGQPGEVMNSADIKLAHPTTRQIAPDITAFSYSGPESKALWCSAGAFRGEPGPASSGYMEVIS